jgi:predicted GH43/DUF377 family glycosyl hydrolase
LPFGLGRRLSNDPVIAPRDEGWESAGTFNPAVVVEGDKIVMLSRAHDRQGTSRLGHGESTDGIPFTGRNQPVFSPETNYERDHRRDPRK